jgi:hypothetical protein
MINFQNILKSILTEAPNGSIRKRLESAILNRNPVSFYYNGPREDVLAGRRIKTELVAMGLTKKGNLVVRGWVQPPSTSKKGFGKHGWRLFILERMSGVQIYDNETFNEKRPDYTEGKDDGSLTVTYVKSRWDTTQPQTTEPKPTEKPQPLPQKTKTELPQPKPKEKPTTTPQPEIKRDVEVYNDLKNKINNVDSQKSVSPEDVKLAIGDLYKRKLEDWKKGQIEIGGNTNPGEGTRRRFEKESEYEIYSLLKQDSVTVGNVPQTPETPEEPETPLMESIKRIKTLIFS